MDCDCAVIGAGPAGLHCSTYLGRYRRKVIVFDGGRTRASWIPRTHNFPAFPEGISGNDLLALMRRQAELYGCEVIDEAALSIDGSNGDFTVRSDSVEVHARKIILATGVVDIQPDIPDALHFKGRTIRHCPICDAYEARDRKMAVFGVGDRAAKQTIWLSHYSKDLTLLTMGHLSEEPIRPTFLRRLEQLGIPVLDEKVERIEEQGEELGAVLLADGSRIDNLFRGYSAMGLKPNSRLAADSGIALDEEGYIKADGTQRTSVPGIYAAGDVVSVDLGQLAVAVGHAAAASTAIHNGLLMADGVFNPR